MVRPEQQTLQGGVRPAPRSGGRGATAGARGQHEACHGEGVTRLGAPADGGDAPGGHAGDIREQAILDTALALFLERGYSEVSLARIASAARLTPAEVHRRFGSKSDLLGLLVDREIRRSRQPFLREVPDFDSTIDAARYLAEWHRGVIENTPLVTLMRIAIRAAEGEPALRDILVSSDGTEACQAFMEHVMGVLIERGLFRDCDARTAVRQYFGMMNQGLRIEATALGRPIDALEAYLESCARAFCALYGPDSAPF